MWRSRSLWVALAAVLYVVAAAVRAHPIGTVAWSALIVGPLLLLVGWRLTEVPPHGVDRVPPRARASARVVVAGAGLAVVALMVSEGAAFVAIARLGLALAAVGSLAALVNIGSLGGVAALGTSVRYEAVVFAALLWLAAVGPAAAAAIANAEAPPLDALSLDYTAVAAALGTEGITLLTAYRLYAQRRFELGVGERAAAALWLSVLALMVGVFAALMAVAPPERVVPLASLVGSVAVTACAVSQRPTLVTRVLRTGASLTMLCAPLVSVAVVAAFKAPTHAGLIMFVVTIAAALLGLASPRLAARLAPERGLWLRVLDDAIRAAKEPDPRQAIVAVLTVIRDGMGSDAGRPALYRLASQDRVTVDRAGYLHTEQLEVPSSLMDIAGEQPERVLGTEALRHVQVHRPEVRDLVAWLDARSHGFVALVYDDDVCVGMLAWPHAGRVSPLSYEETRAARLLADHLGAVTGAAAQLARSRARELEAESAVRDAEYRVAELRGVIERQARRQRAFSEVIARPARVASYSPAAQSALVRAERLGEMGRAMALITPAGVDPIPWAAVVHLASPRSDGTLLVVDATVPADQPLERWKASPSSPFEAARDGTLLVVDPQALPVETQRLVATQLPADTGLILVLPASTDPFAALDAHLVERIGDRSLKLPTLADRAEDLRALALHKLSRIGARIRGMPYGLSLEAQELLNDYPWPGDEAELDAVLLRAALAIGEGNVVSAQALVDILGEDRLLESGRHRRARGTGS